MGWSLFAIFAIWCISWFLHTPSIGYAIGALAVVASVMAALMENLKALARFAWIILLFGFLWVEMKAIDEDKRKTTKELTEHFASISDQAQKNLKNILDDESKNFGAILDSQEKKFSATISQILRQQQEQNREFNAVLAKQQQLFERQQEFTEFLTGKLLPASDSTPPNNCSYAQADDVFVFLGTHSNATFTNKFPHTILLIHKHQVISIDRSEAGSLVLSVDMRDTAGRVIAKLSKNGFVVSKNYDLYLLRPDKSTLIIEDGMGKEILKARFINPKAFAIEGTVQYQDRLFPLELAGFSNNCFGHAGEAEIVID